jgi:hypothetical protein
MAASSYLRTRSVHGSHLCEHYELRITRRCARADLGEDPEVGFRALVKHDIVRAFVNKRTTKPNDTKRVSPLAGNQDVYRLAIGHRHRGATWHDVENRVVWLLAYAQHEFEYDGDAFPYFKALHQDDQLLPSIADYAALFAERAQRFALLAPEDAARLLETARAKPGVEHRGVIGGELGCGVAVEVADTLEEAYVAVKSCPSTKELAVVMAAFFPDAAADDLEWPAEMPARALDPDELCFRYLFG